MSRAPLPSRRTSEIIDFQHDSLRYTASISRFDNGHLAEVFLDAEKVGAAASVIARDLAVTASLALQYGCPATVLRKALTHDARGIAAGPLGALLDLVEGSMPAPRQSDGGEA
ncbi:hypothetical protein [Beijerinckia mobilis]|uniref:hypothetical protein n=1 Tax=Beijerinckia mobilis TaxID=231434 RepID=UPI00068E4F26|nr:hypothetical protein [Beijerinckia mobilis]